MRRGGGFVCGRTFGVMNVCYVDNGEGGWRGKEIVLFAVNTDGCTSGLDAFGIRTRGLH